MAKKVVLLVGTKKGLFLAEANESRSKGDVRGPDGDAWPVNHAAYDAKIGTSYAAGMTGSYQLVVRGP